MNIQRTRPAVNTFGGLSPGDVFSYENNSGLFLKLNDYEFFDLESNFVDNLLAEDNEVVHLKNAKLVIE